MSTSRTQPKRRRLAEGVDNKAAESQAGSMNGQLRRLVHAANEQRQYDTAAWYAELLVAGDGQQPDDVMLLADALFHNGEYQRALHVLSHYGCIDPEKQCHPARRALEMAGMAVAIGVGGVAVDSTVGQAVAGAIENAEVVGRLGAGGGLSLPGAVKLDSLPSFLLAAQCFKALKAWDK
jgi:hypothetical protein